MSTIIKFLTAGSVDNGKSTLIGRLLYDLGSITLDRVAEVKKLNHGEIDYSLFVEGLESERKQKITIDVAYRYFSTENRKFIIADAPGHEQYTKNMAVAASNSDIALILVDASEGITQQTIRHTYISYLFGIKHYMIIVNKLDLHDYSQEKFNNLCQDYKQKISDLQIEHMDFFPITAIHGDNIVDKSKNMPWHQGKTILNHLLQVNIDDSYDNSKNLLYVVQNSIKFENKRFYQGRILSGQTHIGDDITIHPDQMKAKIIDITHSGKFVENAQAGSSISLSLNKDIDIDRGTLISSNEDNIHTANKFYATILWFSAKKFTFDETYSFIIKLNYNKIAAEILKINYIVDFNDLLYNKSDSISQNQVASVEIELSKTISFTNFNYNKFTGSFLLIDRSNNETVACGLISSINHEAENSLNWQI